MSSFGSRTNRWLVWFHRWAGVVLCLFFAVWFASGAVLHFVGFPSLSGQDQHANSETIDLAKLHITPSVALGPLPQATDLRLVSVAGRPRYLERDAGGDWIAVAGDSGDRLPLLGPAMAQSVAEAFGQSRAIGVTGLLNYDQWIVHQHFDPFRPFFRVRLNDELGTDLYVSARTGEVVQRTRRSERAWNWVGAVIHWIYFTPLRRSWSAWNQVVWWLSLVALLSAGVGTWLGISRMVSNRKAKRPGLSPFRGWMRWHHIIGVFASIIVVTWTLSGWLSMDHGRLFSHGEATPAELHALRGLRLNEIAPRVTLNSLAAVSPATSVEFSALASHPLLTAYGPDDHAPRILFLNQSTTPVLGSIPDPVLTAAVRQLWPDAEASSPQGDVDALYRRAESAKESAVAFTVGGAANLRVYVDRYSGGFVAVMDASRRGYAWIYYALHTLQLPGLIDHPQWRSAVVLSLLAVGFAFSITGVILSVVRLRRELT